MTNNTVCSILRYYALYFICGALGVSGHGLPFFPPIDGHLSREFQKQNHNSRIKQDVSTVASRSRSDAGGAQQKNKDNGGDNRLKATKYVKRYSRVDSLYDKIPKGEGEGQL